MELFPDGAFVRLESRGRRDKYIHADGDWFGVSLRGLGSSSVASQLESVWRVEHWDVIQEEEEEEEEGAAAAPAVFLHLQNAAYGRYLCFSRLHAPTGHRGRRAVQGDFNEPPVGPAHAYVWRGTAERVDPDHDHVRLRYNNYDLRANGRHRPWNTGVTLQINRRRVLTTMMQWTVHAVAASHVPIPLPDPVLGAPPPPHQSQTQGRLHRLMFWRWRAGNHGLIGVYQHPGRTIRHVRADDNGVFIFDQNLQNWAFFETYDHSAFNLRTQLAQLQNEWNGDMLAFTLCIVPGSHGRTMPLVTDLPRSLEPVNIVVHRTGSPAAAAFVYPQIDAPAP